MDEVDGNFAQDFLGDDFFLDSGHFDCAFDDSVDCFFDLDVDVFDDLHLLHHFLNDRNVHDPLHFPNHLPDHLLFHELFDELRHLHHFLDHSRDNHHFLHHSLHLHHARHLHHLLNYFLHDDSHLFDAVDCGRHLHDLLLNVLYGLGHLNVDVDKLFDFDDGGLVDDEWFLYHNFLYMD